MNVRVSEGPYKDGGLALWVSTVSNYFLGVVLQISLCFFLFYLPLHP